MKKLNTYLIGVVMMAVGALAHADSNQLPESWYKLPEDVAQSKNDSNVKSFAFSAKEDASVNDAQHTFHKIFGAYTNVMDEADPRPSPTTKWHLSRLSTDIGVTHKGRLGILPFKGTAGLAAFWKKVDSVPTPPPGEGPMGMTFENGMSEKQINAQVETIYQAVLATGRVRNKAKLRNSLFEITKEFLDTAQRVHQISHPYWQVSRYYLDRSLTVDGDWINGIGTEIDLRIRLGYKVETNVTTKAATLLESNLTELFLALADDLTTAATQFPKTLPFAPSSFRFGLGYGVGFDVGVAKVDYSTMGHLEMERTSTPLPNSYQAPAGRRDNEVLIISGTPTQNELKYAKANGIKTTVVAKEDNLIQKLAYNVSRNKIRDGLAFAMGLAGKVVNPASRIGKKWEIYRLDVNFSMGVGFGMTLPILDGASITQMSFVRN